MTYKMEDVELNFGNDLPIKATEFRDSLLCLKIRKDSESEKTLRKMKEDNIKAHFISLHYEGLMYIRNIETQGNEIHFFLKRVNE